MKTLGLLVLVLLLLGCEGYCCQPGQVMTVGDKQFICEKGDSDLIARPLEECKCD